MKNFVVNALADVKIATATTMTTAASGGATWLGWIPKDIGLLASFVGTIASIVVVVIAIDRRIHSRKKDKLELEKLKKEIERL